MLIIVALILTAAVLVIAVSYSWTPAAKVLDEFLKIVIHVFGAVFLAVFTIFALSGVVHLLKDMHARPIMLTETAFIIAYLLGSIPFGFLLTKFAGLGDIRKVGSGNIGATNVLRTGNRELAALTLLLDGAKGFVAVIIAGMIHPWLAPLAGLLALIGHMYPVWIGFQGGKGVATAVGVVLALAWPVGLVIVALWLLIAYLFRYSSLAALVSIGLSPLFAYLLERPDLAWLTVTIAVLVFTRHAENIKRLYAGKEPKIGGDKKKPARRRRKSAG